MCAQMMLAWPTTLGMPKAMHNSSSLLEYCHSCSPPFLWLCMRSPTNIIWKTLGFPLWYEINSTNNAPTNMDNIGISFFNFPGFRCHSATSRFLAFRKLGLVRRHVQFASRRQPKGLVWRFRFVSANLWSVYQVHLRIIQWIGDQYCKLIPGYNN